MERYGKILNGALSAEFTLRDMHYYYEQVQAEECPDGYKPVERVLPYPKRTTDTQEAFRVVDDGEKIVKSSFLVSRDKSYAPRTFSKLKAVAVLMQAGYWERCKQFINEAGLYDLYLAAQDFREDNVYFKQGLQEIKADLGLTDEQVEAILSQCVADKQ